jgi:hypothetical protein
MIAVWLVFPAVFSQTARSEPAAKGGIVFASAVSADYGMGKSLRGWEATSLAVQATLAEWQRPQPIKPAMALRDPAPDELGPFLARLPGYGGSQVLYLAARHTCDGAWQFTGSGKIQIAWSDILKNPPSPHACRLVILDVCHAAAITTLPAWEKMGASATLLASNHDELTWELDFTKRQPIDLATRFPAATSWLKKHLPATWDGRLSYLGLIWVQAFLQTPAPPQTVREWRLFFGRCEAESRRFQNQINRQRSSTLSQFPAAF